MSDPLPQIEVHITGPMRVGKTTLAAILAGELMTQGHTVTLHENGRQYIPTAMEGLTFDDPRQIKIVVQENRQQGLVSADQEAVEKPVYFDGHFHFRNAAGHPSAIKLLAVQGWSQIETNHKDASKTLYCIYFGSRLTHLSLDQFGEFQRVYALFLKR